MVDVKGLDAGVQAARAAIRKARAAIDRMNTSGAELERTATEIAEIFEEHTADLQFEAQTLGNSPSVDTGAGSKGSGDQKGNSSQPSTNIDGVRPRLPD